MKTFNKILVIVLATGFMFSMAVPVIAATTVSLGTADDFAILAGSGITIGGAVNASAITGDIGSFPTATITGSGNAVLTGTNHAGDATTQGAKAALTTAYSNAAGQTPVSTVPTELGGTTKAAGIYDSAAGTFGVTGTLTLDAAGDPNAIFIFKAASTLITAGASSVTLINGAQACNVFWQVGSSATLGAATFFKGNILALTSIGLGTTANVEGRVLAQNGAVTLDGSDIITKATCVVPPPPPAPAPITSTAPVSSAGNYWAPLPLINVTKIPSPLDLPSGPGSVSYTYSVTNVGKVAMRGVWVTDNKCKPVNFISGDSNNDSMLDLAETWTYRCTKVVALTETNTATAHGQANGWDGYDTANATVVVGLPVIPPLIHLVKTPNVFVLPVGGGAVTYAYTVTNPGTAPLSNVSVIDDKCTGLPGRVVGHPGDLNKNNLLESNETWIFTCQTNITQTTTNAGTAEGHANGLTAIDFSPATVVVSSPTLPNTGIAPDEKNAPWNVIIPVGISVVLFSFFLARRKQTIQSRMEKD